MTDETGGGPPSKKPRRGPTILEALPREILDNINLETSKLHLVNKAERAASLELQAKQRTAFIDHIKEGTVTVEHCRNAANRFGKIKTVEMVDVQVINAFDTMLKKVANVGSAVAGIVTEFYKKRDGQNTHIPGGDQNAWKDAITKNGEVFVGYLNFDWQHIMAWPGPFKGVFLGTTYRRPDGSTIYAGLHTSDDRWAQSHHPAFNALMALHHMVRSSAEGGQAYYGAAIPVYRWPFETNGAPFVGDQLALADVIRSDWKDKDCSKAGALILFRLLFLSAGDVGYPEDPPFYTRAAFTDTAAQKARKPQKSWRYTATPAQ